MKPRTSVCTICMGVMLCGTARAQTILEVQLTGYDPIIVEGAGTLDYPLLPTVELWDYVGLPPDPGLPDYMPPDDMGVAMGPRVSLFYDKWLVKIVIDDPLYILPASRDRRQENTVQSVASNFVGHSRGGPYAQAFATTLDRYGVVGGWQNQWAFGEVAHGSEFGTVWRASVRPIQPLHLTYQDGDRLPARVGARLTVARTYAQVNVTPTTEAVDAQLVTGVGPFVAGATIRDILGGIENTGSNLSLTYQSPAFQLTVAGTMKEVATVLSIGSRRHPTFGFPVITR